MDAAGARLVGAGWELFMIQHCTPRESNDSPSSTPATEEARGTATHMRESESERE